MHRMNDQSGNVITQFFAWLAAVSAALGFSTQDMVFMFFGLIGVLLSLASFISGRLDAQKTPIKRTSAALSCWKNILMMPESYLLRIVRQASRLLQMPLTG
ncbi:Uncharacterised protein [Enterobacter cancerogenus]|uniref:Uncharacterized protein n=1 Tax=Enterobacter cancerogenus TaxID=69218 RepID=A0A484Z8R2_9ENTR|nr:Uncharacterised protein [Enterobacter cancerogenus]